MLTTLTAPEPKWWETSPETESKNVSGMVSHPSGVTDPITNLLGSDSTTIVAVLFLFVAIAVAAIADANTRRGPKLIRASIISICASVVTGAVACLVARQGISMPAERIVQIFSGAGAYGALIWGILLLIIRIMFPLEKKQVAKADGPVMVSGYQLVRRRGSEEPESHHRDYM